VVALKHFSRGNRDSMMLWWSYELMEHCLGDVVAAKNVYHKTGRRDSCIGGREQNSLDC
jgi:hypothetical protein